VIHQQGAKAVAPPFSLLTNVEQVGVYETQRVVAGAESLELRVALVASGLSGQHCSGEKRLAP